MKNRKLNSKRFDSVDSFSRASKTDVVHSARRKQIVGIKSSGKVDTLFHLSSRQIQVGKRSKSFAVSLVLFGFVGVVTVGFASWRIISVTSASINISGDAKIRGLFAPSVHFPDDSIGTLTFSDSGFVTGEEITGSSASFPFRVYIDLKDDAFIDTTSLTIRLDFSFVYDNNGNVYQTPFANGGFYLGTAVSEGHSENDFPALAVNKVGGKDDARYCVTSELTIPMPEEPYWLINGVVEFGVSDIVPYITALQNGANSIVPCITITAER